MTQVEIGDFVNIYYDYCLQHITYNEYKQLFLQHITSEQMNIKKTLASQVFDTTFKEMTDVDPDDKAIIALTMTTVKRLVKTLVSVIDHKHYVDMSKCLLDIWIPKDYTSDIDGNDEKLEYIKEIGNAYASFKMLVLFLQTKDDIRDNLTGHLQVALTDVICTVMQIMIDHCDEFNKRPANINKYFSIRTLTQQ